MKESLPRGMRNNNPGNIRISKTGYLGEVTPSQDATFKQFSSMDWGYRAIFVLLYTYQNRYGLNNIREMINRYAPPVENNTKGYIDRVARESGIWAEVKIDTLNPYQMQPVVAAISAVENGRPAEMSDVKAGWELFIQHKP